MRFTRFPKTPAPPAVTPRKLAHAKRVVERDAESVALFPELRRETTPEDRLERLARGREAWEAEFRQRRAQEWLEARQRLRRLPRLQRLSVIRYWQRGTLPGSPEYLKGLVYECEIGRTSHWHTMAALRRLELVREGRLPRELVFKPCRG